MADYYYTKKTGAPSKFKPEYVQALIKYFEEAPKERKQIVGYNDEFYKDGTVKRKSESFKIVSAMFPTLLQFAKHINIDYATLNRWAEKQSEGDYLDKLASKNGVSSKDVEIAKALTKFREVYAQAKQFQKEFMIENGMSGASPSGAFVFVAKNVTDMRDKSVYDVTHREVKPLLDNLRNKKKDGVLNNNSNGESSEPHETD